MSSVYCTVPVHTDDQGLLGMKWEGKKFVDASLPSGLRSAPKLFNAIMDALRWILVEVGVDSIHYYLDDFLIFKVGREVRDAEQVLERAPSICAKLGVTIAMHKTEGPTWVLTFFGIELDTQTLEAAEAAGRTGEMEEQEKLQEMRIIFLDRPATSCLLRDEARTQLPQMDDQVVRRRYITG